MGSTIVFMMRRVHLSNDDLQLLEWACQREVNLRRLDASRQENPRIKGEMLERAAKYERLAARLKRFREPPTG